jgi:hypothetical protein
MKTLVYTSIYSKLWGTEFGGRPSRDYHYKSSLYNILNINATKFICFTSKEELNELENYFYTQKNVSKEKLEFKIFDLVETKNFNKIRLKKDLNLMKETDRCFEIQYNKFYWLDHIDDLNSYDRVFWIDAGLSHSGLFPESMSIGPGYDRYFWFNVFNEKFLNELIIGSENKVIIVGKENLGEFYWSKTLPKEYYNQYDNSYHIIGGFFGGKVQNLIDFKNKFEVLLENLLEKENNNFMEELIMGCLYFNNKEMFNLWTFQDWYERPNHNGRNIKYFYNLFDNCSPIDKQLERENILRKVLNKKYSS